VAHRVISWQRSIQVAVENEADIDARVSMMACDARDPVQTFSLK
jgi:hypothetical protein